MSERAVVRRADGIVRALFSPFLLGIVPHGWTVTSWDAEQGLSLTLERGGRSVLVEFEDRDDARDCYAHTARFNVCARLLFDAGDLTNAERSAVNQIVTVMRQRESLLPKTPRPEAKHRSEVRQIEVERVLIPQGRGHYYINPYAGCMIGCRFCYVAERADLSRRIEGLPPLPWGRWVDVKVNAAEVLRREVKEHPPGIVRMSPILTDPYQPVEKTFRITRQCLEVLLEAGFTPVILTRGARIVEDLDLLRQFARAAVGFSIPTDDDRILEVFEPGADPAEARFSALEACRAAGLHTFGVIQPMLPMNAEHLVARMAPNVRAVRIDRMHQLERAQHLYAQAGRLDAAEPDFFERVERTLRDGFAKSGVIVDELDDLGGLIGA